MIPGGIDFGFLEIPGGPEEEAAGRLLLLDTYGTYPSSIPSFALSNPVMLIPEYG